MSVFTELPVRLYQQDAFKNFTADSNYQPANARAMIWLSQLAYENPKLAKFDNILRMWGLERVTHASTPTSQDFGLGSTFGFVAANKSVVIVVFRGTDPLLLSNWITDFTTAVTADGLHKGFADASKSIWDVLKDDANKALTARPGAKLIFTGHSLGAAMAVIAASNSVTDAAAVYTFGMPRAGTPSFVTGYNGRLGDRTFRLVYGDDIVPTLPGAPFRHVGRYLHSQAGDFNASLLTENPKMLPREQWSNHPEFDETLRNSLATIESAPALTLSKRLSILGFSFVGGPTNPRGDVVGALISTLPTPLRDHIPDRYWGALQG